MRNNGKGAQTFLNTKVVFAYITLLTNYNFLAIDFYYEENLGSIIQIPNKTWNTFILKKISYKIST